MRALQGRLSGASVTIAAGAIAALAFAPLGRAEQTAAGIRIQSVSRLALSDAPGDSLTTMVIDLAPGAELPARAAASTTFAIVLDGSLRVERGNGMIEDLHSGDMWAESARQRLVRIVNASGIVPARVLRIFVAPSGPPAGPQVH